MKKIISILFVTAILNACSNNAGQPDKRAQLEDLRKQQAELKEKIAELESELQSDTSNAKGKLVSVTDMEPEQFIHFIEVQARVEGEEDVLLSAQSMGMVTSIPVNTGDRVLKGQLLATIDDKVIRENISELQAQLDLATQLFNKQKNLWDQQIGSEVQFLQAKTNKEALERRMSMLNEQHEMTKIKSPINGVIDEIHLKIGQTVAPGTPAVRVINLNDLKVRGSLAESYISKVNEGNDVIIHFPDLGKEIKKKVDYAGRRIDPLNRTFNVEVELDRKDGEFHPNMIAVMKIADYKKPSAMIVPVGAVQKSSDAEFVYVAEGNGSNIVAKRKIVETGQVYNGRVEVVAGLESGDRVITNGYQNIIEGDRIKL